MSTNRFVHRFKRIVCIVYVYLLNQEEIGPDSKQSSQIMFTKADTERAKQTENRTDGTNNQVADDMSNTLKNN